MLFDLGWSEILLVGVVALVFIGPKDLPKALRVAGFWVRKARTLSREFQSSIDQMIRESELDEMRQELKKASEFDLGQEFHNTIEPSANLAADPKPPEAPSLSDPRRLAQPERPTESERPAESERLAESERSAESERLSPAGAASLEAAPLPPAELPERPPLGPGPAEPAMGAVTPRPGEPPAGLPRDIAPPPP